MDTYLYVDTCAPHSISATITLEFIPKENCAVPHRYSNPEAAASTSPAPLPIWGGTATAIFPAGGATGEHLVSLLADENVPVALL